MMDKEKFCSILQSALFSFDGMTETEIIKIFVEEGLDFHVVKAGIKLCNYLNEEMIVENEQIASTTTTDSREPT